MPYHQKQYSNNLSTGEEEAGYLCYFFVTCIEWRGIIALLD